MTQKIQKNFSYLFDDMPPGTNRDPERALHIPSLLEDEISLGVDGLGTTRYGDMVGDQRISTNSTTTTQPAVASGILRKIFFASCDHNDGAANHTLWLAVVFGGFEIGITPNQSVASGENIALPSGIYIPANGQLRARSLDALGVGNSMFLDSAFVDMPIGSYVVSP